MKKLGLMVFAALMGAGAWAETETVDGVVELTVRPVPPSDPVPDEPVVDPGDPTVVAPWSLGDLNGDGRLSKADRRLLAQLMQGNANHVTAHHLRAGDYNGNGRLDNGDYQLLTEDFRTRGIIR